MHRLILFFLLLSGCQSKKESGVPQYAYPVKVVMAKKETVPLFIEALGHVDSIDRIEIRSRVQGELTGIFFKQGQMVKKGDLLFTIDAKPYTALLQSAKGVLEQGLAELMLAEEKVKRYKPLTQMEFYSQINYETLQSQWEVAKGKVQQSQGELDKAAVDLDYCWIYAPIDGILGIQQIDLGNLVEANGQTPLITLNQIAPIYVTFSIPEAKLHHVQRQLVQHKELPVWAAYENFKEEIFQGTLYMLDNQVDDKTGMIKLRALFQNENRELWPGQFVRTRLILSTLENAILIPYTAIQLTDKGPIGFVVLSDQTVEQRSLKLGQREDDSIVILEGIQEGETLVVEGQLNLYQGAQVDIIL